MLENTILSSLVEDEKYAEAVLPHLVREYFEEVGDQVIFSIIKRYFLKYNRVPTKEAVGIETVNQPMGESIFESAQKSIDLLKSPNVDREWLIDQTEIFCKHRAFHNAILKAVKMVGKDDVTLYNSMLGIMENAISVSFDKHIGHDFIEDALGRYESLKEKQNQLKTGLKIFDIVTKGGFVCPSLTVFMASTGVGKSLTLCHFASDFLSLGKNVLYITMEMSEEKIAGRIDANLLDMTEEEMDALSKNGFLEKIKKLKTKTNGRLVIKNYPSRQAHSGHFRHLINELKSIKKFSPDVIMIDYLSICGAASMSNSDNSYEYNKTIAQELRGLGQEFNVPVMTAVQTNRAGTKSGEAEITDVAESWGIAAESDYLYGILETEELAELNQFRIKRLKDRYQDYASWYPSFLIGVDKSKQRLFDLEDYSGGGDTKSFTAEDLNFKRKA